MTPLMSERKTALIGAVLVALGPISMALYTPAMPELVTVFGTDIGTVKLTLTAYFAGFAVTQLVCGPLSDAYGRRPILVAFLALYLAGSVMAFLAPSIGWLLAARIVQGVGASVGVATARAIVRDLYTGSRSVGIMNTIGLMLAIGPAISPTIGGLTLDFVGWRAIFALMVAYGLAAVVMTVFSLPETLAARDPSRLHPGRLVMGYLRLLGDRRFMAPVLVIGATLGGLYTMATILPFVLIDRVGLTPTEYGVGMIAQSGAYGLGAVAVGRLLKRLNPARLVWPGLLFCAAGGLLLAVLLRLAEPSFLAVMGPVGVFAVGIAFLMPAMTTAALAPFGREAGAASALMGFIQIGGGLLGSMLAALSHDPVTALATIIPGMAATALLAHIALGRVTLGPPKQAPAVTPAE